MSELAEKYPELYDEFMIHMAEIGADREPDTDWFEAEHSWWIAHGLAE